MKALGVFVLGLLLGVLASKLVFSPTVPVQSLETQKEWAQAGVKEISEAGDAVAQMKAAEEYYGKAVVLFLASLARQMAQPPAEVGTLPEPIVKDVPAPGPQALPDLRAVDTSTKYVPVQPSQVQPDATKLAPDERALQNLVTYRRAPLANKMTPQVRRMNGLFEGRLIYTRPSPKKRIDRIDMDMNFTTVEGKLTGNVAITLTDEAGNAYSQSRGDGNNQTLRLVPGRKDQIYLEPRPGDFILLDLKHPQRPSGRYYDSGGEQKGIVELWRKN